MAHELHSLQTKGPELQSTFTEKTNYNALLKVLSEPDGGGTRL